MPSSDDSIQQTSAITENLPDEQQKTPAMGGKAVKATVWLSATQIAARSLTMVRIVLLARLLDPSKMGLFGAAMLTLSVLEVFTETGLNSALVQRARGVNSYLNTAWTITLLRGFVLAIVLFFAAPYVAVFLNEPEVTPLLQVLAIVPILTGLTNNGAVALLNRDLQFRKLAVLQVSGSFVELVAGAIYAYYNPTVWALVIGRVAGMASSAAISYLLTDYRPRFELNWKRYREMQNFGFWIFASGIVGYILVSGGDWVIAKLLPVAALGIYQLANNLSNLPTSQMAMVITRVAFPVFSRLQEDPERLRTAFLKSFAAIATVVMLITTLIISLSNDFVMLFLGERWRDVAPVMQCLCVWGACRGLGASNSTLFQSVGKPQLAVVFQVVMLALFAILIYPLAMAYGAWGVGLTLGIVGVFGQIVRYPLAAKEIQVRASALYWRTFIPVTAAIIGVTAAYFCRMAMPGNSHSWLWLRFIVCGVVAGGVYCLVLWIWERFTGHRTISEFIRLIRDRSQGQGGTRGSKQGSPNSPPPQTA